MDKNLFAKLSTLTSEAEATKERIAIEKAEKIITDNTPAMLQAATNGAYAYTIVISPDDTPSSSNYTVKKLQEILNSNNFTTQYFNDNTMIVRWREA